MAGLQVLEEQFGDQGFHVLGFYSNDFGSQGGTDEQIEACNDAHAVSFDQFQIAPVTGPQARPVFTWILSHANPGPKPDPLEPTWNFHKYLVSRDGQLVAAFDRFSYPGEDATSNEWQTHEIVTAIQAELAR
jgi:glutathione peroxidase